MEIAENSPQGQNMQWSEKMQKLQKLHFKLYRPQLARQTLRFATVHLEKDSISMSCLEELSGESFFYLKSI